MSTIIVGQENSTPIEIYYEDHGSGQTVVLLGGWPLDSRSWEPQIHPLLAAGQRVITYDRRGFGQSSRPTVGYDFDTLAGDLDKLLTHLDLHEVTLVGFSLGTGEMARYLGTCGTDRVKSCVFIESLAPSFAKSEENPNGVDQAGVAGVQQAILDDRFAWLTGLVADILNTDEYLGKRVSEETVRTISDAGADASPWATWACPPGWLDDFGEDIKRIDVPTLILHGTADRILLARAGDCTPRCQTRGTWRLRVDRMSCASPTPRRSIASCWRSSPSLRSSDTSASRHVIDVGAASRARVCQSSCH